MKRDFDAYEEGQRLRKEAEQNADHARYAIVAILIVCAVLVLEGIFGGFPHV